MEKSEFPELLTIVSVFRCSEAVWSITEWKKLENASRRCIGEKI